MGRMIFLTTLFIISISLQSRSQSVGFSGSNYANAGNAAALHVTNFTLEAWVKIEGTGATTSSGSGGVTLVPFIAKGRAESELAAVDVNYIFGYDLTTRKLVADFEDNATSANHPVTGNTALGACWTHVAATYNTATNTWKLYINGVLDQTLALGAAFTPQSLSNVSTAIGTSLNSTNATEGFFNGSLDELRVWNVVRTDAEIFAGYNAELTSGTGLVSRWGFNDGSGTSAVNSIAGAPAATLVNNPAWVSGFNQGNPLGSTLDFNGTTDYVTFGAAPVLNTTSFTLEAWIKIEGTGVTTVTSGGADGLIGTESVIPIVAKGRGEGESPANINMNYILGIKADNVLVADFEESAGPNHKAIGTNAIPANVWTHVAATYGAGTWNLYINGVLDKTETEAGAVPVGTSIQHASVGTAMNSTGVAAGFFNGKIDEVRIWNLVRTQAEIQAAQNAELTAGTGLIGRWGFNEGCGLTAGNSIAGSVSGTLSSSTGPVWSNGNYNSQPPAPPTNPNPAHNGTAVSLNPDICATVSDPNGGNIRVRFYGRKKQPAVVNNFTIIGLPDTQFYTEEVQGTNSGGGGHNGIFKMQTQWIADHRVDSNIVFVSQLGDCVQNGDNPPGADKQIEWKRADTSMKKIESPAVPVTCGIPYSICVGNHDQATIGDPNSGSLYYNQYFGAARFNGRAYYGGHYGADNDNHYELFSAGGIDFIHISLEYNNNSSGAEQTTLQAVLNWADALLKTHSTRKAILSTHNLLTTGNPASFQGPGQKIYDDLKDNPNLFLMLAGHVAGEGRRTDVFAGNTIYSLMSDYQSGYSNGGNGFLRIMQFRPAENLMTVKTYSPYSNSSMTGSGSQFSLPVSLTNSFALIGETNVVSGSTACVNWPGLEDNSEYEWYAELFDGLNTTTGPVWLFTTSAGGPLPVNLVSFNAFAESKTKVKTSWTTSYERNNNRFEVERSKDGRNFSSIGTVPGLNNSSTVQHYSFYDNQPFTGISFYRLKQVDVDGNAGYSNIERVNIAGGKTAVDIYPNPARGNSFNINILKEVPASVIVSVIDSKGSLLLQKQYTGSNTISVLHRLPAGIYTVNIQGGDLNEAKKLIIK